jgi:aryl-alcohol dehydrogenase-like predicted oxidoreductase
MPQLTIAWLLHRSPMMRTSSPEHFQENLAAAAIDISAEDVTAITQLVPEDAL